MSWEQAGETPGSGAVSDRMRALLSRAAEEQLLEQRQVSAVLGELRALLQDVDERLAGGEQVERLAGQVRQLSDRVEARLDEAEARSADRLREVSDRLGARLDEVEARSAALAERIGEATALVGTAAHDLVQAVAAGVAERVEVQLRELAAGTSAAVEDLVGSSERRLATHVDDAALALAEVVLRRRSAAAAASPAPERPAAVAPPAAAAAPAGPPDGEAAPEDPAPVEDPAEERPAAPGDGFVLVPADVEQPEAGPAPPVQHERRTADRRGERRSDGSGRRRRPWWRQA